MIKINFYLDGFEIENHANYDVYGKDIVCSGVSAISFGSLNWFEKNCKIISCVIDEANAILKLKVEVNQKALIGLELLYEQLYGIYKSYKKHISLKKHNKCIEVKE